MAREKKTATSKCRVRKAKAAETPAPVVPEVVVTDDEKALVEKYGGTHAIQPGSLRYAGGREGWGNKRTVVVVCPCGAERVLATSDLQWPTTKFCLSCAKDAKRNAADKRKQAK